MKVTFNNMLANALLALLESTTAPLRAVEKEAEKKEKDAKFDEATVKKASAEMIKYGINDSYRKAFMDAFSVLLNAPELYIGDASGEVESYKKFPPFSVIKLSSNKSSHGYPLNEPLIVTNAKGYALEKSGSISGNHYRNELKITAASTEEVIECIKNLNDAQWAAIRSNALFAGVVKQVLDAEFDVADEVPAAAEAEAVAAK